MKDDPIILLTNYNYKITPTRIKDGIPIEFKVKPYGLSSFPMQLRIWDYVVMSEGDNVVERCVVEVGRDYILVRNL